MRKTLLRVGLFLSVLILVAFVVFLINQTEQIVRLASALHPLAGDIVLWVLVGVFAVCLLVPLVAFFRLRKPLVPPASEDSPEFEAHLDALRKRLRANPIVKTLPLNSRAEIEKALAVLDERADEVTRRAGSQVFVTTAISQNGSLDAFLVLAAQSRLVWQIAHIYYQRPSLRDMLYLYANVASTAFIASELEDIDVAEQLQPVITSVLGSVAGAVPGFQAATSIVVNSATTGGANAFLTLRVGIITKKYCSALVLPDKGLLRRSAVAAAAKMLSGVAAEGTKKVSAALWKASGRRVGGVVTGMGKSVKDSGTWISDKITKPIRRGTDEPDPSGA